VIIDFDLQKDSGEFIKQRARAPKEVYYREITAVGFELIETKDAPAIKDNFYAEFRRVERPVASPASRCDGAACARALSRHRRQAGIFAKKCR
jgi:hypothetical protein